MAKKTKPIANPPTPVQLYGYRILYNLLRHNLSRFVQVEHNLGDSATQVRWYIIVYLVALPAWTEAHKPKRLQRPPAVGSCRLEIEFLNAVAVIVTTLDDKRFGKMSGDCQVSQEVDYETLFRALPATLERQAGLVYPKKDQDPLMSAI